MNQPPARPPQSNKLGKVLGWLSIIIGSYSFLTTVTYHIQNTVSYYVRLPVLILSNSFQIQQSIAISMVAIISLAMGSWAMLLSKGSRSLRVLLLSGIVLASSIILVFASLLYIVFVLQRDFS